ncbi:MAG: hypothetical protein GY943_20475 [Chloroflexi bacterium]|nr:hypothetical protein [Chloroflexota bacterium]
MRKRCATAVSWKNKPMPANHKMLALDGMFSREEFVTISMGVIPQKPTDKWFIYLDGEWLHFHRSQSGSCVFKLHIFPFEDRYHADQVIVNRETAQYRNRDDQYDVELVSYLIDHILLGRFAPMPVPKGMRKQDQARYQKDIVGKWEDEGRIDLGKVNGRSQGN